MPLNDLLGLGSVDVSKAEEIYCYEMPECVHIPQLEAFPYNFDLCGYLLQCVADTFYLKHGLRVTVSKNSSCSFFKYCSEEQDEIQKLADKEDEMAQFILNH